MTEKTIEQMQLERQKNNEPQVKVDREITIQAARAAIAQERQQRAIECGKELNSILKKYNCELIATPMFTKEGMVVAQSQIIAKE